MISVVTVPHTGTIYTLNLLRGWGVEEVERKHLENTDAPPYGNERFGPAFPCPSSDLWWSYPNWTGRRVVCTLRDPVLAVISAINRGTPDRMISVDGWAVLADWYARQIPSVHFFPIPPSGAGLVELASFVDVPVYSPPHDAAELEPRNTSEDPHGLRAAYLAGQVIEHPTVQRAVEHLSEMPLGALFDDHGFQSQPWWKK